jgi:hypothetical protein
VVDAIAGLGDSPGTAPQADRDEENDRSGEQVQPLQPAESLDKGCLPEDPADHDRACGDADGNRVS